MSQDKITHYILRQGGEWMEWRMVDDTIPSESILDYALRHRVTNLAIINQCAVHAFKTAEGREWDCINGWRDKSDKSQELPVTEKQKTLPCKCGRWPGGDCDGSNYDLCKLS